MRNTKFVTVINKTKDTVLANQVEIAETLISRLIGLLNKNNLKRGEGLLIPSCFSIHTFFMRFSIDVIFLDKRLKIVKIKNSLSPYKMSFSLKACSVLELPASTLNKSNAEVGDTLKIRTFT